MIRVSRRFRPSRVAILCAIGLLQIVPFSRAASLAGSLSSPQSDQDSRQRDFTAATWIDHLAAVRPQPMPLRGPCAFAAPAPEPPSPSPATLAALAVPPMRPGMHGPKLSAPPRPPPA